jgi:hypothetical protein
VRVGDMLEWVESPDESNRIARQRNKSVVRPDRPQKDVTFRMAKQPEPADPAIVRPP